MDRIILKNLSFYGYHGFLEEEQRLGQQFFIDMEIGLDLRKAGMSDDLSSTVDYGEVFRLIGDIMTKERYRLIEALAERISGAIFDSHQAVRTVTVEIRKPGAPLEGVFDYVAVRLERERE